MSVESACAIAGGFSPRARRDRVTLTHTTFGPSRTTVRSHRASRRYVLVGERWF